MPHSKRTRRYSVYQDQGRWWLRKPDGTRLWSLGVCCLDPGQKFEDYDPKNPGYAAYRHYPYLQAWAADTVGRLRSWGFNTVGAWSADEPLRVPAAPDLNFTPILHLGSSAGAPWKDMWDPQITGIMDEVAKAMIVPRRQDSRIVGYFSDNEQGWWNGALFEWAWKTKTPRQKLVDLLATRYRGDWTALCRDFDPDQAGSFTELRRKGRLYLRPGGNGMAAVHAYIRLLADRYYHLCRDIVHRYDPQALYLGDRYISNFYPEVAQAAARYVDVVSTNLNADWNDGTFARFYLPSLYRLTGKPVMITEYYMAARENRSGNRNDSSGFPVVPTQADRAQGFLTSTQILLKTPYVVGAHWFQYYDEPQNGRGDGEDYDMGLVDVDNRPYEELTRAAASLDLDALHASDPAPLSDVSSGVPSLDETKVEDLESWPRDRAFVPPTGDCDRGDAYLGWTSRGVYLALYWNEDRFAEAFYRGGKVPPEEEPTVTLRHGGETLTVRLSGAPSGPLVALKTGVRNTAILRLPSTWFGSLQPGRPIDLDATLATRSRAYGMRWKGRFGLR